MKPAVVIIDMQKDFFAKPSLQKQQDKLVRNINNLTAFARTHDAPVIWIRQIIKPDLSDAFKSDRKSGKRIVIEGTEGSKLVDGLHTDERDHEVIKKDTADFMEPISRSYFKIYGSTHLSSEALTRTHAYE